MSSGGGSERESLTGTGLPPAPAALLLSGGIGLSGNHHSQRLFPMRPTIVLIR